MSGTPLPEQARAIVARARLTASVGVLRARLAPKTLARHAVSDIAEKGQAAAQIGLATAKKHPATLAGAFLALGIFLTRKPIARLLTRKDATVPSLESSTLHTRAARRNAE